MHIHTYTLTTNILPVSDLQHTHLWDFFLHWYPMTKAYGLKDVRLV